MVIKHRPDGSTYDPVPDVFMNCGKVVKGKICNGVMEYMANKKLTCKKCGVAYDPYERQGPDDHGEELQPVEFEN